MYASRAASRAAPAVFRAGIRTSTRTHRPLLTTSSAIRILIPLRSLQTQTTSSASTQNYPPPGFDPKQASKPAPKQEQQQAQPKISPVQDKENTVVPKTGPTAHPKTPAQDVHTMSELATEKAAAETKEEKKVITKKEEEKKKVTLWQKVKHELVHYWDGTKLLGFEIRISTKLALKMTAGYELTRRERRQLQRTVQDLGRLIPFLPFVIVPFAELLLPVALKLFPNMLPSTYEGQSAKDDKAKQLRSTRKEVSDFLRQTLKETGLPVSAENAQTAEFGEFFRKVRTTGEKPTPAEIIKVCKIFKDDLTLDNLSRPQLVSICRYMNITSFGTDNFLRYQVRVRMRQIKRDDRAIAYEGVETLSVPELQTACASRGLRTYGVSPGRLRDDLQAWLDLRLKHGVPSTLLVLSNAFVYAQGKESEMTSQIDALEAVLSSIPEELYHEIELEVHNTEGAATNKQRLEVLKEQQELINEENEQTQAVENKATASPKDHEDIDEDDKPKRKEAKEAKEAEESKEAEASTGDSTGGSAERTEQDDRARKGEEPQSKEEKSAEAARKE
ncbi:LETM1-domain-containing protein [Cucurbitaria berberidis CBS 394.84]|uniref:LETM1-domain-containing protein n=1 Tax=Cucurbitaria berberidis CBS 394.84 TaxID=1168544 RepID=A0A9P4G7Q2_9PLEO|nr:LETM1-domain-containing protein [Cucurbitaria berberidis CBS 394.84]KAF1840539.1 LETM1-domain-containing protein [Cucurbitaria berberidis CBS 394.84]